MKMPNWMRKMAQAVQNVTGLTPLSPELVQFFGGASAAGKAVNESSAMTLSAAWSCMRIISEAIGSIPWTMYRREGNTVTRADDYDLAEVLLHSPNADMTDVELKEANTLNLCQMGNAYNLVERLAGRVVSVYPIRSSLVTPKRKFMGNTQLNIPEGAVFYTVNDRGKFQDWPREKIWHVKGFGSDGYIGLSPIGMARESMGFALATEEFGSRFFSQGGKPSGVVTIPGFLNADQRKIARENLTQLLGGLANAHKFALFEGGMKPEPWGHMSLEDMAFVLVRKFSVTEMCRIYRIPPHMVGDVERGASYASIEQMSAEFVMFTLLPYFTRFEKSVSKWLIPMADRGKVFLKFNYEALLRADSKGRAEFYASALTNGWMSRNEVRSKEDLNQVAGLDEYTAQTSLAPVGKLGAMADVAHLKPAVPPPAPAAKGSDTTVHANIALPSVLKHDVEHTSPAVVELVGAVQKLVKETDRNGRQIVELIEASHSSIADRVLDGNASLARRLTDGQLELSKAIDKGQEKLTEGMSGMAKIAKMKRMFILDREGNPIGTEILEEETLK